ncbi:MAG: hypothetical protein E4G71_06080 [Candidatus Atribacteria bacterium]|nr:MAG: hypothetical protein E4G71_06080 [Candidatus Atribacteria bacterium]
MKFIKLFLLSSIFSLLLLSNCTEKKSEILSNKLEGAWIKVETKNVFSDSTQIILNPQPCLLIVSNHYYSFLSVRGTEPREPYKQPYNPTPEEMIIAYNSFAANAGKYEKTDSTIITFPLISKVPGYSGGKGVYQYNIKSDTLYLTMIEEYSKSGEWASWLDNLKSTSKYVKAEK